MSDKRMAEREAFPLSHHAAVSEGGVDWESLESELKHRTKQSIRL